MYVPPSLAFCMLQYKLYTSFPFFLSLLLKLFFCEWSAISIHEYQSDSLRGFANTE